MTSPATAAADRRGRNTVTARAVRRVTSAVGGEVLGAEPARVAVELSDADGALGLAISSPIRIAPLRSPSLRVAPIRDAPSREVPIREVPILTASPRVSGAPDHAPSGTLLDRASAAQQSIARQVAELTGRNIGRVTLRLSSVNIERERRAT